MNINFSTLSAKDYDNVYRIFAENFYNSTYYRELFPIGPARRSELDSLVAPTIKYCLENNGALAAVSDGELLGYNLIAEFNSENRDDVVRIFFDSYIEAGDKKVLLLKKRFLDFLSNFGSAAYFYVGVVNPEYRGKGIGKLLNAEAVRRYERLPIMAELTSPEIISVYRHICNDGRMTLKKISEHYHIMEIAPKSDDKV